MNPNQIFNNTPAVSDASKSSSSVDPSQVVAPTAPPNATKDFKEVMEDQTKGKSQGQGNSSKKANQPTTEDIVDSGIQASQTVQQPTSIFDISANNIQQAGIKVAPVVAAVTAPITNAQTTNVMNAPNTLGMPKYNLSSDFTVPIAPVALPQNIMPQTQANQGEVQIPQVNLFSAQKYDSHPEFTINQPDSAAIQTAADTAIAVNVVAAQQTALQTPIIAPISDVSVKQTAPTPPPQIDLIVQQLAASISTLATSDQTNTTVVIKNLPLFNNAQVTITAFGTAPQEYNISFTNLSAEAKEVLDAAQKQATNTIQQALDEKGYKVHIVQTSLAQVENPTEAQTPDSFTRDRKSVV